jgi:hypothetical protein
MPESIASVGNSVPTGPILPDAFDQFVGDTFYRQMLKSMRSGTGKPAFLHGGQAEEIFQSQLDELMITDLVKATKDSFSADLFQQQFPDHTGNTKKQGITGNTKSTKTDPPPLNTQETGNFDKNA